MKANKLYTKFIQLDRKIKRLNKDFGLMSQDFYLKKSYSEKVLKSIDKKVEFKASVSPYAYRFRFHHFSITINIKTK